MHSGIDYPINLGSSELITINELVNTVADIAGVELDREYDRTKPQGVDGRNSDNTRIQEELGWEPPTSFRDGIEITYEWIKEQMLEHREREERSVFALP
jgi:nucleoside-diphosphate-sugar epimerase